MNTVDATPEDRDATTPSLSCDAIAKFRRTMSSEEGGLENTVVLVDRRTLVDVITKDDGLLSAIVRNPANAASVCFRLGDEHVDARSRVLAAASEFAERDETLEYWDRFRDCAKLLSHAVDSRRG
jgi:hypothetical protein